MLKQLANTTDLVPRFHSIPVSLKPARGRSGLNITTDPHCSSADEISPTLTRRPVDPTNSNRSCYILRDYTLITSSLSSTPLESFNTQPLNESLSSSEIIFTGMVVFSIHLSSVKS